MELFVLGGMWPSLTTSLRSVIDHSLSILRKTVLIDRVLDQEG